MSPPWVAVCETGFKVKPAQIVTSALAEGAFGAQLEVDRFMHKVGFDPAGGAGTHQLAPGGDCRIVNCSAMPTI